MKVLERCDYYVQFKQQKDKAAHINGNYYYIGISYDYPYFIIFGVLIQLRKIYEKMDAEIIIIILFLIGCISYRKNIFRH